MALPTDDQKRKQMLSMKRHLASNSENEDGSETVPGDCSNQQDSPRNTKSMIGECKKQIETTGSSSDRNDIHTDVTHHASPDGENDQGDPCNEKVLSRSLEGVGGGTNGMDYFLNGQGAISSETIASGPDSQGNIKNAAQENNDIGLYNCIGQPSIDTKQVQNAEHSHLVSTHTQTCACHVTPNDLPLSDNPLSWSWVTVEILETIPNIENEQFCRLDEDRSQRGVLKRGRQISEKSVSFDLENDASQTDSMDPGQLPFSDPRKLTSVLDDVTMVSSDVTDDDTARLVPAAPPGELRDKLYLVMSVLGLVLCPITGVCALRYSSKALS